MSAQPPPIEQYPIFNRNNFNDIQGYLTIAQANLLYARLYAANTLTQFNTFQSPIKINNINISNAGTALSNIYMGVNINNILSTGYNNITIGSDSLKLVTTGYQNISLGSNVGVNLILGAADNISIGTNANSLISVTPNSTIGSIAIGRDANSNDDYSISIGNGTTTVLRGVALGYLSRTLAFDAISIGNNSAASGSSSIAIGQNSITNISNSIAIGNTASGTGNSAVAIGNDSIASGLNSVAIGDTSLSNNNSSIAIGHEANAIGLNSICLGDNALSNNNSSIAIGHMAQAIGLNSICLGDSSIASGSGSIALGQTIVVSGTNSTSLGTQSSTGVFTTSTALGYSSTATANNQIMIGTASETVQMPNALNVIGNATFTLPIFLSQPLMNYASYNGTTAKKQGHTTTSTTSLNATTGVLTVKNYATVAITSAIGLGSYFIEGMVNFSSPPSSSAVEIWINNISVNQDSSRTQVFELNRTVIPANWYCKVVTQFNVTAVTTNIYLSGLSVFDLTITSVSLRVVRL